MDPDGEVAVLSSPNTAPDPLTLLSVESAPLLSFRLWNEFFRSIQIDLFGLFCISREISSATIKAVEGLLSNAENGRAEASAGDRVPLQGPITPPATEPEVLFTSHEAGFFNPPPPPPPG